MPCRSAAPPGVAPSPIKMRRHISAALRRKYGGASASPPIILPPSPARSSLRRPARHSPHHTPAQVDSPHPCLSFGLPHPVSTRAPKRSRPCPPPGPAPCCAANFAPKTEKPAPRRAFCIIPALFHVVLSPSILQPTPFSHGNTEKLERASVIPDARSRFSIRFYLRFACPFAAMERALRSPSGAPCCGGCPRSTRGTGLFPPRSAAAPPPPPHPWRR